MNLKEIKYIKISQARRMKDYLFNVLCGNNLTKILNIADVLKDYAAKNEAKW